MTTGCLCAVLVASVLGAAAPKGDMMAAVCFYVATTGSDANPGTLEQPFATIARARDVVRERQQDLRGPNISVLIRDGRYELAEPLRFGPEDGGRPDLPICYAAVEGEEVVLTGGQRITGWKKGEGETWTAEVPDVKTSAWSFNELFVDGQRRPRARHPNAGYLRVDKPGPDNRTSFTFKPGDLKSIADLTDAELVFLHDWSVSRVPIASIDEPAHAVRLAAPIGASGQGFWAITGFEPHPRYFVENAREFLDAPGEWHLDRRAGILTYRPMPDEDLTKAEVVAPRLTELLVVAANPRKDQSVGHLHFRGLTFQHCAFARPAAGYAGIQAGFHEDRDKTGLGGRMPAAIRFLAARHCLFERCTVEHVGGAGISFEEGCIDCRLTQSEIRDCGGNGVMVGGPGKEPASVAKGVRIEDCRIHHCGQTFFGCVGVWAGITNGTVIRRNEIHRLPYSGVSVGWQWNPEPTPCGNNLVEENDIHHVMQTLSDGGGIYTLGRQPGTVLRANRIHDIPANAGRAESNGLFIDEGSSEILIEGNTIEAVARSPIRFHQALRVTVRRNTLVCAPGVPPFRFNACDERAFTFDANTVRRAGAPASRASSE
jgi:hypothetical protein